MVNQGGYYQMHRGWMRNAVFGREPFTRAQAWIWMIEEAGWRDEPHTIDGETVTLRRGQFTHSTRYMGKALRWSEAKVRRFLKRLKVEEMIETTSDAGQFVVTIANYERYQTQSITDAPNGAENKGSPDEPDAPPTHQPTHLGEKTDAPNGAENKGSPDEPDAPPAENRRTNRRRKGRNSKNPLLRKDDDARQYSAAPPSGVPDPAALVFQNEPGGCLHYLIQCGSTEQKARKVLGNWRGQFGDGAVIDAVSIAVRNAAAEPVAYISAVLKRQHGGAQHDGYQGPYSPDFPIN